MAETNKDAAFVNKEEIYDKEIKAVPKPELNIGIDTNDMLYQNLINAGTASVVDLGKIESFTQIAKTREQLYQLLDSMGDDSAIAAILETYSEDATEYAENGRVVWVESSDADVSSYINYLLDAMCVDKNIYKWVYSLCKYGDLYLRLYRSSEYKDLVFDAPEESQPKILNEDINIKAYADNDKYVPYLEMIPNPAEMFELTRFGKTAGYIQAEVNTAAQARNNPQYSYYLYKFKRGDINIYQASEFVHASLEDNSGRVPEEVDIFLDNQDIASADAKKMSYRVRRGQSLLYSTFKVWRQLMLLENSVLLNRLTKSSIVRLVKVEVGDMDKQMVGPHLQGVKSLIEQKAAINTGEGMSEYTNPGPVENNIYIPTHNGIGAIDIASVGGDVDVKGLADLDYYRDKFYGSMRIPKQYFGYTSDGAGFDGGKSLSIISSRYAKMIKRIQNTILQALTDAINLMLLNSGLQNYINNFTLKMQPPTTQEEIDRRDNVSSKVQLVRDIMDISSDVTDVPARLKMLKSLLSSTITDTDVIQIIQDEIDTLEEQNKADSAGDTPTDDEPFDSSEPMDLSDNSTDYDNMDLPSMSEFTNDETNTPANTEGEPSDTPSEEPSDTKEESLDLPYPHQLGVGDLSDMTNPNIL